MQIKTLSIQGTTEWNEDALVINERLRMYGVLDGATSLQPYRGPNKETGGYLASQALKQYFEALSSEEMTEGGLLPHVIQANRHLREKMTEAGIDTTCKETLWTSALALIRISDRYVDYAQVGDCMIMAQYEDGSIRVVSRDHVAHMDKISKNAREEGIRQGLTTRDQLLEFVKPKLLQNRTKMNTIEGYSVMSGEPEVADLIEYGRINRIRLKSLLLVTDGLFLPADQAADSSNSIGGRHSDAFAELMSRVADSSLEAYAHELIDVELEDKECLRYPRFKVSDDKTGIWIQFD